MSEIDSKYIINLAKKAIKLYGMQPIVAYEYAYEEALKQYESQQYVKEVKDNLNSYIRDKGLKI